MFSLPHLEQKIRRSESFLLRIATLSSGRFSRHGGSNSHKFNKYVITFELRRQALIWSSQGKGPEIHGKGTPKVEYVEAAIHEGNL